MGLKMVFVFYFGSWFIFSVGRGCGVMDIGLGGTALRSFFKLLYSESVCMNWTYSSMFIIPTSTAPSVGLIVLLHQALSCIYLFVLNLLRINYLIHLAPLCCVTRAAVRLMLLT